MSAAILKTLHAPQGEDGMRTLYRTYGPELYGFAVNCLGDRGQAEEIVQDVFTRVWRHADSFDPSRASFRTWIYGIARNAIIDLKRRGAVRPSLATAPADLDAGPGEDSLRALRCSAGRSPRRWSGSRRSIARSFASRTSRACACARSPSSPGCPSARSDRVSYALRGMRPHLALGLGVEP